MAKLIDMTGQRFGALTVIGRAHSVSGRTLWRCVCDCGKECVQEGYNLRKGLATSCGCGIARREKRKGKGTGAKVDYTGQTFGRLTAIRHVSHGKWLWRCSCGNETIAKPADVKNGKPASCGCALRESSRNRASEGNVFDHYDGTSVSVIRAIVSGKVRRNNASGCTGISVRRNAASVSYRARIMVRWKEINLGTYASMDDAVTARKDAERKYFGEIISEYDFNHHQTEGKQDGRK